MRSWMGGCPRHLRTSRSFWRRRSPGRGQQMADEIRRKILTHGTAMVSIVPLGAIVRRSSAAGAPAGEERVKFQTFLRLSSVLTGIRTGSLIHAVEPLSDLKFEYYGLASRQPAFNALLKVFGDGEEKEKLKPKPDPEM